MQVNVKTSPALKLTANPVVREYAAKEADVIVVAVCPTTIVELDVLFCTSHDHPVDAVGNVSTPTPVGDVPTVTLNAAVLNAVIVGDVPKPDAIVGGVAPMITFGVLPTLMFPVADSVPATAAPVDVANTMLAVLAVNTEPEEPPMDENAPVDLNAQFVLLGVTLVL